MGDEILIGRSRFRSLALTASAFLLAIGVAATGCSDPGPTFGTIPLDVINAHGAVEADRVPDYISVVGPGVDDGIVGYVKASFAVEIIGSEDDWWSNQPVPVFNKNLELVGHMFAGRGFVPITIQSEDAPEIAVTTTHG